MRETELQRRNMTRPELIDVPYDLAAPNKGPKDSVVFGVSYEFAVTVEVPSARPWVGRLAPDSDRWGCTLVLRNSGAGSARIIASSLEARTTGGSAAPVTIEGRSESRFVPRGEVVRLIFEGDASSFNIVEAAENESAIFTATVTYEDFERIDTWETRYDFALAYRGPDRVDVSITRVS
jgi:hypothetical protein